MLDRWLALGRQPTFPTQFRRPEHHQDTAITIRSLEQGAVSILTVHTSYQYAFLIAFTADRSP